MCDRMAQKKSGDHRQVRDVTGDALALINVPLPTYYASKPTLIASYYHYSYNIRLCAHFLDRATPVAYAPHFRSTRTYMIVAVFTNPIPANRDFLHREHFLGKINDPSFYMALEFLPIRTSSLLARQRASCGLLVRHITSRRFWYMTRQSSTHCWVPRAR